MFLPVNIEAAPCLLKIYGYQRARAALGRLVDTRE